MKSQARRGTQITGEVLDFPAMLSAIDDDWVKGRASLGAAAAWTAEEIRLIADLGYALAEYGRDEEALTIFEGLAALAPATAYFQSALGALLLRIGDLERAELHLNSALAADPQDVAALVNRGELYMRCEQRDAAIRDFLTLLELPAIRTNLDSSPYAVRARALLTILSHDAGLIAESAELS
jgi:Flp pilus assembly protein TadD